MRTCIGIRSCAVLLVAMVLLSCNLAFAKGKAKQQSVESGGKFTSRTQLVLVPVLVTDKSGQHISGLKKEDFKILEQGTEQKIAIFEEVTTDQRRLSLLASPNEFTNYLKGEGSNRRVTVIVLDLLNTSFADRAIARAELAKYLSESLDPREPTALYVLTSTGLKVIHDFTANPRILVAAVHKARGDSLQSAGSTTSENVADLRIENRLDTQTEAADEVDTKENPSAARIASEAELFDSLIQHAEQQLNDLQRRVAVTTTLEAMRQVAETLSGLPGRKSLIWATGGFPFGAGGDPVLQIAPKGIGDSLGGTLQLYQQTWEALNNAQVALYPIDVKGLAANAVYNVAGAPTKLSMRNPGNKYVDMAAAASWRNMDTLSTFQRFADMTGGRAYFNTNDLAKCFRSAVQDSARYYMLGYYLDRSDTRPGWRKLAVKVNRDGVTVRSRNGFFVTSNAHDPATIESELASALRSPLDYTGVHVVANCCKIESGTDTTKKHISYELNLPADTLRIDEADKNHIRVKLSVMALTPEGQPAAEPVTQVLDTHMPQSTLEKLRQNGLRNQGSIDLPPGEYKLRFVVRDDLSGQTGSVAVPLEVE